MGIITNRDRSLYNRDTLSLWEHYFVDGGGVRITFSEDNLMVIDMVAMDADGAMMSLDKLGIRIEPGGFHQPAPHNWLLKLMKEGYDLLVADVYKPPLQQLAEKAEAQE